ncbi:MAG: DNA polymerase III subunit delta [Saprospiraceae bacterium]|nr:DNA polymerase III subunit delta [Saprospiraceae bacterium]
MMSNYRLIIIKEAQEMKTLSELYTYVDNPSTHSILVLCHKYKKVDKRTKFGKLLEEKAVVFESKKIYENQIVSWVVDYLKIKGYAIEPKASSIISDYIGNDLNRVSNELDKLILGLPLTQTITADLVKEQIGISKDFNVFELQTALGDKNFVKANLIIRYFSENSNGNPLIPILSNLFTYFNKVYIALTYNKESDQNLLKLLGLGNNYFLNEYKVSARNYTYLQLKKIFTAIKKAELNSKGVGVRRGDEASILKDILVACMNP